MSRDHSDSAAQTQTTVDVRGSDDSTLDELTFAEPFEIQDRVDYERVRVETEALLFGAPLPSSKIGRFAVFERIGQGGMGTVYAAYDDQLERRVAVKVLRSGTTREDEARNMRLLREARAMAKLSHPNVVTVYEVGEHEGQPFVAMEFISGVPLNEWLHERDEPRLWSEVVAVFRQAGAGLVAAHTAGIVHRDFKPHNVMLGEDGIVRVLDFGLARTLSSPDVPTQRTQDMDEPRGSLTAPGTIMGTPAYMSPEQIQGQLANERSDQFSFCVALFEGLYGQRPFRAKNFKALVDALTTGQLLEPSPALAARVPSWIHTLVVRGLAADPGERHPSMGALVEALARDPRTTRRRWLVGAALALTLAGGITLPFALARPPTARCLGVESELAEVYTPARMQRARAAVEATQVEYAAHTWSSIAPLVRHYAQAWADHSRSQCEAHEDGRLSTPMFDRASSCMAGRLASLDALLGELERADMEFMEKAVAASELLEPLEPCANEAWLMSDFLVPEDPRLAAKVETERARLAQAKIQIEGGQFTEARHTLEGVEAAAEAIEFAPLDAELALAFGTLAQQEFDFDAANAALSQALRSAVGLAHQEVAAEALSRRVYIRGWEQRRLDEAQVDAEYGGALLTRLPAENPTRWLYFNNSGTAHEARGELDQAMGAYAQALDALELLGDEARVSTKAIATRSNIAQLEVDRHQFARGIAVQRELLGDARALFGPGHPTVADMEYSLANSLREHGEVAEANQLLVRALNSYELARGPQHPDLRAPLQLGAKLANERRRHAHARELSERGLALSPVEDFYRIELLHSLGSATLGLGETAAGLELHREALAMAERFYADSEQAISWSHHALALALLHAEELDEALTQARRAVEQAGNVAEIAIPALACLVQIQLARGELADADPTLVLATTLYDEQLAGDGRLATRLRILRAELELERGKLDDARLAAQHAVEALQPVRGDEDPELARSRFLYAQVLHGLGEDGHEHAEAALASYTSLGSLFAAERDEVERWRRDMRIMRGKSQSP